MRMRISRIVNLCIAAIVLWVWLSMTFRLGRLGAQSEGGFRNLRYFTVLSNVLQGGVSLVYVFRRKVGCWKYVSTVAIALTFCIVLFFLGPTRGYNVMYSGANFWSHLAVPVLAIADFLFLDREGVFSPRDSLLTVIPLVLYGLYYMGNIIVNGAEGNDWYGFAGAGALLAAGEFIVLLAVNWLIAVLLRLPRKKPEKRA